MNHKIILGAKDIGITLERLACQLIENHGDFNDTVLVGLQPRGAIFADRIKSILEKSYNLTDIKLGYLDITFFRDDFRRRDEPLEASQTKIDFLVEDKNVVFIDDVLHSGRSVRAALTAIQSFGRPKNIELLVLVDRRFSRSLPIQPDYRGRKVDSYDNEKVIVKWVEQDGMDGVYFEQKND
jgi:pyrimidine operon attenuation protein/uracil phosphoribosyltransferase